MEAEISINYLAISTELIVIFTIVGTISLDLILSKKSKYLVALFALVGSLISFIPIDYERINNCVQIVKINLYEMNKLLIKKNKLSSMDKL